MPLFLPGAGFKQQVEEFTKQLAYISDDVEVRDDERSPIRRTSYWVEVMDPATSIITTFDYREEFTRMGSSWVRLRYWYELRFVSAASGELGARRAHHDHARWHIHQHCETGDRADAHYRDVERLLQATHELFVKQYAGGGEIDCSGLVPLATRDRARD